MNSSDVSSSPKVAELIVQSLVREGVDRVFGMPGSHVLGIFDAVAADGRLRFVPAAHENTSVFMASMHGHLTGTPGVALLTAGPGATNAVTAVAQAKASSFPLVHLTGDVPVNARREAFHGTDDPTFLHQIFAPVCKWSVRLGRAEDAQEVLAEAFRVARSGRPGPVHVDVPLDLAAERVAAEATPSRPLPSSPEVPAAFLRRVLDDLRTARRPFIVACRGIICARAEARLVQLAERLGAPVLTTAYGLGAMPGDHPLFLGTFSEFSQNAFAFELLKKSDYLLAIGLRAGTAMTELLEKVAPERRALAAFEEPGSTSRAAMPWQGELAACTADGLLDQLLAELSPSTTLPAREREWADVTTAIATQQRALAIGLAATLEQAQDKTPLHFGRVMQTLRPHLRPDAMVFSGVGNHHVWARQLLPVRDGQSFIAEAAWGTMGGELGGGLGAKLAFPGRQVVVVTGDASLLMVSGDLATAAQLGLPLLVVVLNDSRHGIIGAMQRHGYGRAFGDELPRVDFRLLAESMGVTGIRIEEPAHVHEGVRRAVEAAERGPVLLDVVCDPRTPWPNREKLIAAGLATGFAPGGGA